MTTPALHDWRSYRLPTDKPLVLADELAKIVRDNDPVAWLMDASAALHALGEIQRVKEQGFTAKLDKREDRFGLELYTNQTTPFCIYEVPGENAVGDHHGVVFCPAKRFTESHHDAPKACSLSNEQEFIAHLLRTVRIRLNI